MAYVEKNWLHRLLQFFLGAALGGAAGVAAWKDFPEYPMWIFAAGGALVLGVLAAVIGDRLWHGVLRHWRGW